MKIGIDARFLTHPQAGGFKTYTENLIRALSQIDDANDYVVYVDRPVPEVMFPSKNNFRLRVVGGTLPLIGMVFREQVALRRFIAKDKPDVVHFLCNTAPLNIKEKYCVTLHDTIQVTIDQNFRIGKSLADHKLWAITAYSGWVINKTAKLARRIITVSDCEKTQISKYLNIAPYRICVTHLAPNPLFTQGTPEAKEKWRAAMCGKFDLHGRFILGIGYEARKNIPLLIDAFSKIESDHPNLNLVIVVAHQGQRLYFQQLISELRLNSRVIILAALPPIDLVALYNLAEVFVFPSERESFGLPPLEAMACGTPTLAMNMSSIPEILRDGAMLINGKDVQTWSNAIKQVLADENLRSDLVSQGLKRAAELTWERCARETINVYNLVAEMHEFPNRQI
jgi:glycosyltransferase involved in cell wall biosynthesis